MPAAMPTDRVQTTYIAFREVRIPAVTRDIVIAILSLCVSVRCVPVFCQNGLTHRHSFFTHHSSFVSIKHYLIALKHIKSLILLKKLVFISNFNIFILMFIIYFLFYFNSLDLTFIGFTIL